MRRPSERIRWAGWIVGVVLILAGGVWLLQGVGVLGGSFMTGKPLWAEIGGVTVLAGVAAMVAANRLAAGRPRRPGP
jgi:hypothetical protein